MNTATHRGATIFAKAGEPALNRSHWSAIQRSERNRIIQFVRGVVAIDKRGNITIDGYRLSESAVLGILGRTCW